MLRSSRFLPRMGFGLREISLPVNPTIVFGFLSLLFAFFLPKNWDGKLAYNLCVISSLFLLGFSVRRLSLRCDQFRRNFSLIWAKLTQIGNGLCSNGGLCAFCGSKMRSLKLKGGCRGSETEREKEVMELKNKLRRERKKRKEAIREVEREREASAWASEEAMAKIMLLQSEKALIEREARQYREVMEKKQLYDKEVIDYLQLVVQSIAIERGGEQPGASRSVLDLI